MDLQIALASVTPNGILYMNHYYTYRTAIREYWYHLALVNGSWDVEILVDPCSHENIYIVNRETGEKDTCSRVVIEQMSDKKLEHYYISVQKIKNKQKQRKKHRKVIQ